MTCLTATARPSYPPERQACFYCGKSITGDRVRWVTKPASDIADFLEGATQKVASCADGCTRVNKPDVSLD